MKKLLFVLLPLSLMLAACDSSEKSGSNPPPIPKKEHEDPDDPNTHPDDPVGKGSKVDISHYVTGYVYPKEFKVNYLLNKDCFVVSYDYDRLVCFNSTGDDLAEYEALCDKRGDVSYDKVREEGTPQKFLYDYLASDIVSMDLVADKAFGDRAAGSSWSDICWLKSTSPSRYIASGYTKIYDWSVVPKYFNSAMAERIGIFYPECEPVVKLLSECTAKDLALMQLYDTCSCCELYLTDGPYPLQSYNFTVILKTENGLEYTIPVKYE